jgi:SNF2 family DNA or RNA helicase
MIQDHKFTLKPFKHQYDALAMALTYHKYALLMEMGTGKTKVAIDFCSILRENKVTTKPTLIICPNSVLWNWAKEVDTNESYYKYATVLEGTKKKRISILEDELKNGCQYFIINYEGVLVLRDKLEGLFDIVICDESTRIKNHKAQTTRVITELFLDVEHKLIMSGTPITQSPLDIYAQYNFLDKNYLGSKSFYAFRNRHCEMGGFGNYEVIAYKNMTELKGQIEKYGYIIKKEDCLDLPEKIYQTRELTMTPDMLKQYKQMRKEMIIELSEEVAEVVGNEFATAQMILVKLLRLSEITSGKYQEKEQPKMKELEELLTENVRQNKVVIWCRFTDSINKVTKKLTDMNIGFTMVNGTVGNADRQKRIDEFNTNSDVRVMVAQIQSMGMGINLTSANLVIYYENTYSLQDRLQSEDRTHRVGQKKNVVYVDLVYNETIDEGILEAIKAKKQIADSLVQSVRKEL